MGRARAAPEPLAPAGRIDRKIEFPLPDEKTKKRIFQIHTSRMTLADDVTLDDLIMAKDDLSGADIKVRLGSPHPPSQTTRLGCEARQHRGQPGWGGTPAAFRAAPALNCMSWVSVELNKCLLLKHFNFAPTFFTLKIEILKPSEKLQQL